MGLLEIFPDYRNKGLATVLESFMINRTLKNGYIPYCNVFSDNAESIGLQEKLGLYPAKKNIWWLKK